MSLLTGVSTFAEGVRLIRKPALLRYAWIPAVVSLLVIGLSLWLAFGYITDFSDYLVAQLPGWLGFLSFVLTPLLYLLGLLTGAWFFGLLAVLLSSPLLGDLSIAVERDVAPDSAPKAPDFLPGLALAVRRELRKLAYHLPRLLGVAILSLIPGVNVLAPLFWFVFGAWTLAVQFADYPAENRNLPFAETLARLRSRRWAALGFGACATVALAVPLLNFLLVPVAVVGGTLLWLRSAPPRSANA